MIDRIYRPMRYLLGQRCNKKIIVIDSDDWGSIRIPNKSVRDRMIKKFPEIQNDSFYLYDTIASGNDLTALFEVLNKHKDSKGNHPCITVNTIMANPDFDAISKNHFDEFIYERFDKTIERYYSDNTVKLWKEGLNNKLFFPQLHGREHLHALQWIYELKNKNEIVHFAFANYTYCFPILVKHGFSRKNVMSALNLSGLDGEAIYHEKYLTESVKLFNDYFGFPSNSFIAPAYIWNDKHEEILSSLGVKLIKGLGYQYSPINSDSFKKIFHYTGQRNKFGQYYLIRNAFFEPSLLPGKDWVNECLKRIDLAFKFKKPAIIGSHRVNFIGTIEEKNRTNNLILFDELLKKIINKWPDVEFSNINFFVDKQ